MCARWRCRCRACREHYSLLCHIIMGRRRKAAQHCNTVRRQRRLCPGRSAPSDTVLRMKHEQAVSTSTIQPIPDGVIYARELLHMPAPDQWDGVQLCYVQTIKSYRQILKYVFNENRCARRRAITFAVNCLTTRGVAEGSGFNSHADLQNIFTHSCNPVQTKPDAKIVDPVQNK